MTLDLIAHTPREEIIYFWAFGSPVAMTDVSVQFPNIKGLHFEGTLLPDVFPNPNSNKDGDVFPSVQHIFLDRVGVGSGWGPLITFLRRRASARRQLDSLVVVGSYSAPPGITQEMVGEFRLNP